MSHQIDESSESTRSLVNTWSLVAFAGEPLLEGVTAELTFTDEGRVFGIVGVNRIMGDYQATQDTVIFGALATTLMMGPPNAQAQESMLLMFLHDDLPYLIERQTLSIGSPETEVLQGRIQENP